MAHQVQLGSLETQVTLEAPDQMVSLVSQAQQDSQENQGCKVAKDSLVPLDLLDQQAQPVTLALLEITDYLELLVHRDLLDQEVNLEMQDRLDRGEIWVSLGRLVLQDNLVLLVFKDCLAQLDLLDLRVKLVNRVR